MSSKPGSQLGIGPIKIPEPKRKPMAGAIYFGRIEMHAAISDEGYVCEAAIGRGLNEKIDTQVLERFRARHFPPIIQNREPVAANVIVYADVWKKPDGEVMEFPEPKLPKL